MGEGLSLINLGELSKPATVLIEKISEAVGGIYRPHQISRIAKAEAEAEKIRTLASMELTQIQERAFTRLLHEEESKQRNIESITAQAISDLPVDADPENIEVDWIVNFFEKCKLISDQQMQSLWAKLLTGEATTPGTYSKRTILLVSNLDKKDAELFTKFCTFTWLMRDSFPLPIIYSYRNDPYKKHGIKYAHLNTLDTLGLITFDTEGDLGFTDQDKFISIKYFDENFQVEFEKENGNLFKIGVAHFTDSGRQLATICGAEKSDEYLKYTLEKWNEFGYKVIRS